MPDLLRVVAIWEGFPSAPGYSNFYFESATIGTPSANDAAAKVRTFFDSIKSMLPTGVVVNVQPNVAEIDEATGVQGDEFVLGTAPLPVNGMALGTRAGPAGCSINWKTGTFVGGRRLRGRTFLVPLSTDRYENDGTLGAGTLTTIRTAANALCANDPGYTTFLHVWHRPVAKAGGSSARVTSASVTDKVAMLTSRR